MAYSNRNPGECDVSHTEDDHFSFRLPKDQLEALRARAREEDRTVAAELRRAVARHLEEAA